MISAQKVYCMPFFFSFRNLFEVPKKTAIWHDQICGGRQQMMLDRGQSREMKVAGKREEFKQRRGDFLVSANLHQNVCTCSPTIMRDSSCPLLGNVSWDTKYFNCNERINHLQNKSLFVLSAFLKKIEDDEVRKKDTSCTLTSPLAVEPFGLGNC